MSTRYLPVIVVLCIFPLATLGLRAEVAHFGHEMSYIAGLRKRGLNRLAELRCQQLAADSDLSPMQQVRLNVELTKTLTGRALNSRQPERDEFWRKATSVLKSEIGSAKDPSARVLLQLQLGLTMLEQAAWARREAEIRAVSDEDWLATRSQIRAAINQLKDVQESLTELTRLRAGRDFVLSSNEVAELQRNTNYALARGFRNQAIAYSNTAVNAGSADGNAISPDQVSALTQALKYLQPLANDTVVDDVVWKSRVERIECYRLRGQLETAHRLILEVNATDTPADVTARLAAEGVRLALAANRLDTAIGFVRQHSDSRQPELELARVETLVAMAKQEGASGGEAYRKEAAEIAARLDREHGTYWGMRGEILIAKLSERLSSTDAGGGANNNAASLLETTAKTLLKQGRPEEAIETFLRAATQAKANQRPDQAFDFLYKVAVIHQQEGQLQSAIDRFRDAANTYPNNARAGEAHLQAAFNGATLYQQFAKDGRAVEAKRQLADYDKLLQEHLSMWSTDPSADQARIWYGRLSQALGKNKDAIEAYRGVSPGCRHASDSYLRLGKLYGKLFAQGANDTAASETDIHEVRSWFKERLQLEDSEETVRLLSAELAKLSFLPPQDYRLAQETLDRALPAGIVDKSLRALKLVALAGTDTALARVELGKLLPLTRESLIAILNGLQPIRDERPTDADLRAMAIDCVKLIRPYSDQLSADERLLIEQFVADNMLADQALPGYRKLAAEHPQHRRIQLRYAELASLGRDRAARDEAMKQWRAIVSRSKPRSPEWFRAKLGVAQTYFDKGEHEKSKQVVELLTTLYPELGGANLKQRFQDLLRRIESNTF